MLRIRELREAKGIQQKELAIDLGVTQPTISDWESGRKVPSAKNTAKLADYFGVSVDYVLCRENEKKPTPVSEDGHGVLSQLDDELLKRLLDLSPSELDLVDAFVQGLLASR